MLTKSAQKFASQHVLGGIGLRRNRHALRIVFQLKHPMFVVVNNYLPIPGLGYIQYNDNIYIYI